MVFLIGLELEGRAAIWRYQRAVAHLSLIQVAARMSLRASTEWRGVAISDCDVETDCFVGQKAPFSQ